jgi:hypothetical protein
VSDFEEKLNAILSNPESMGQIMNLAQSLNLGGGEPSGAGRASSSFFGGICLMRPRSSVMALYSAARKSWSSFGRNCWSHCLILMLPPEKCFENGSMSGRI